MKMKRFLCVLLAAVMVTAAAVPVLADEEDDLKAQRSAAYAALDDTNAVLEALAAEQMQLQSEIKEINQEIVDMMVRIEQAKQDIAATEAEIADTESQIANTSAKIDVTKENLAIAEDTRDKQYQDMKKRIQYIYENGGDIGWATMLFSSDDIASFFNKAEYTEQLHAYDREQLEAYIATVEKIESLKAQLEEEMAELHEQMAVLEEQKEILEAQKLALEEAEAKLEEELAQAEAENADYDNQIAEARAQAQQIESIIAQMNAEIARIQEAKRKAAEEAARRAAEAEARRKAEAEAVARIAAAEGVDISTSEGQEKVSQAISSGAYGSDIVAYANKYVGGRYVYGGNSLTGGIDCSHFVYNVLKNTGTYSGGYTTSTNWATRGSSVGSLSEAKAGDVIVYSGHVAIYDGNGRIVEAQNPSAGITNNRSATSDRIIAIRRFG